MRRCGHEGHGVDKLVFTGRRPGHLRGPGWQRFEAKTFIPGRISPQLRGIAASKAGSGLVVKN